MRVLVVSHTYISPINRDKWKMLAQRHPDVSLMVIFPKRWPTCLFQHKAQISQNELSDNCSFMALDSFKEGNELLYRYSAKQLFGVMKTFRPNIIHVEQGGNAFSFFQVNFFAKLLRLKAKSVFFTWINWQHTFSLKGKMLLKPIEKINMACSHGAIAGNHDAEKILRAKGFAKPVLVLPQLGINRMLFAMRDQSPAYKRSYKYVAFIGRITEEKGVFYLARAFLSLANQFPDWKLLFVGTGPAFQRLKSFVAGKRMLNRVEMYQSVPHETVASMIRYVDILVLPSYETATWREQFGHILIEAMASGVSIIGSDAGEIPFVIGDAGLIFKQRNEAELLAQLKTLMQDDKLRKKLGMIGYQRAHSHYSHEAIADKTYAFWQQLGG